MKRQSWSDQCSLNNQIYQMDESFTSAEHQNFQQEKLAQQITTKVQNDWKDQNLCLIHNNSFDGRLQKDNETILQQGQQRYSQCPTLEQANPLSEEGNPAFIQQQGQNFFNISHNPEQDQSFLSNSRTFQGGLASPQDCTAKIYEQIQSQDESCSPNCLKSFLSINETNYRPHIFFLKLLFGRLKAHSSKSLQHVKLVMSYLQIKLKQQMESLKSLDDFQVLFQSVSEGQANRQSALMDLIRQHKRQQKHKRKELCDRIKQIYERLISVWIKVKQKREKRQKYVEEQIILKIDRTQEDMCELIKHRFFCQKQKSNNPQVSIQRNFQKGEQENDRYLQTKYLMRKQNEYLQLISDFNAKTITYMISMFSKEELLLVQQTSIALQNYKKVQMACYGESDTDLLIESQEDEKMGQCQQELTKLLLDFIPEELFDAHYNKDKKVELQDILLNFSSHMQNTIYLSTIEMNNELILFRNEAKWKIGKQSCQKSANYLDYQNESNEMSSSSNHIPLFNFAKDVKIVVILTCDYYLHIQHQENAATVKLNHIKVARKGREVKLSYKKKGIGGYFGMKTELGRLQFETNQQADIFMEKVELGMRKLNSI